MPRPRQRTWIAIADGGKALLLESIGSATAPALAILSKRVLENPRTGEQQADRPGRYADTGPGQRSAFEVNDWHQFAKIRFAKELASMLDRACRQGAFDQIIIVAPGRVLGTLREALAPQTRKLIRAEMNKDLTNHPVSEIIAQLRAVL